jgi:hypothetical protein
MWRGLSCLLACLALTACNEVEAPQDSGVCWRAGVGADHKTSFTVLARGIDDLDTCAVLLEGLRLQGQANTDGAFQGYFIFVNAQQMASAPRQTGFRYPIFQPPQRASVDRDLKKMMATHGGKMPDAADLTLQRQ